MITAPYAMALQRNSLRVVAEQMQATRWSGPLVARRRGTTSLSCPEFVPNGQRSELHYPHMVERMRTESDIGRSHDAS